MSWEELILAFRTAMESRGLASATIFNREKWLWQFRAFCYLQALEPTAVTFRHVSDFGVSLGKRYSELGCRDALQTVRFFYRWGLRTQRLLVDPTDFLELPNQKQTQGLCLSVDQVAALLQPVLPETRFSLRDRALLEVLYGTGMRRHEAQGLDLSAFNRRDGWFRITGKGRKMRLVVVGPHLNTVLEQYLSEARPRLVWSRTETAFFVSKDGDPLTSSGLSQIVYKAGQRIGLPLLGTHALRRSCATHMLAAGATLDAVRQLLGHSHLSTTHRYVQLSFDTLREEHESTHPRHTWQLDGDSPPH